jgi:hypothetical protein
LPLDDAWSVIRLSSVRRLLSTQNKVSILCLNCLNTILVAPRQQLSEMANGDGNGDGQRRWQLQWPTVTKMAMAGSKGNGNGNG